MSEIFADEKVTDVVKQRAYVNTERMLEVRVNPETHELIFIGTGALVSALEHGIDVERYLRDKLTQVRDTLIEKH
jgi:hypothetical protein